MRAGGGGRSVCGTGACIMALLTVDGPKDRENESAAGSGYNSQIPAFLDPLLPAVPPATCGPHLCPWAGKTGQLFSEDLSLGL